MLWYMATYMVIPVNNDNNKANWISHPHLALLNQCPIPHTVSRHTVLETTTYVVFSTCVEIKRHWKHTTIILYQDIILGYIMLNGMLYLCRISQTYIIKILWVHSGKPRCYSFIPLKQKKKIPIFVIESTIASLNFLLTNVMLVANIP